MLDNNHKNSPCLFAEQLVSYLYDEASPKEKNAFEAHLNSCSNCAAELAGFGFVRSSVLEWQKEEFEIMETPKFVFPNEKKTDLAKTVSSSNKRQSWLSELRKLFSLSPAWATASTALAILAICVGLVFIGLNFSRSNRVAENGSENVQLAQVSTTGEKKIEAAKEKVSEKNSGKRLPKKSLTPQNVYAKTLPHVIVSARSSSSVSNNSVAKISNVPRGKAVINKSLPNANDYVAFDKKQKINGGNNLMPSIESQRIPKFVDVEEDEDNSLRLADLFEEVDSR